MGDWTLFSNYGLVLVCLQRDNEARLRDVAADVGITERAVQKIVRELQLAEFVSITRHGRRNHYEVNTRKHLRHSLETQCTVGRLLELFTKPSRKKRKTVSSENRSVAKPESVGQTVELLDQEEMQQEEMQQEEIQQEEIQQQLDSENTPPPLEEETPDMEETVDLPDSAADTRQQQSLF